MEPFHEATAWGLRPILFHLGGVAVPSYSIFMLLALAVGIAGYLIAAEKVAELGNKRYYLLVAEIIGGTLGAKIPIWIMQAPMLLASGAPMAQWLSGRTVVGGLIGGVLAVLLTRRFLGISWGTGNLFAPGLALAMAIGRVGCLLRGCCAGVPTDLPWGIDFGDGIPRHPTQLYELLFDLRMFVALLLALRRGLPPGRLFAYLMLGYFSMRFGVEFLRMGETTHYGLTLAQLVSLGVVAYYGFDLWQARNIAARQEHA